MFRTPSVRTKLTAPLKAKFKFDGGFRCALRSGGARQKRLKIGQGLKTHNFRFEWRLDFALLNLLPIDPPVELEQKVKDQIISLQVKLAFVCFECVFGRSGLPLARSRWVRSKFSSHCLLSVVGFRFLAVTGPLIGPVWCRSLRFFGLDRSVRWPVRSGPFRTARWDRWAKTDHTYCLLSSNHHH